MLLLMPPSQLGRAAPAAAAAAATLCMTAAAAAVPGLTITADSSGTGHSRLCAQDPLRHVPLLALLPPVLRPVDDPRCCCCCWVMAASTASFLWLLLLPVLPLPGRLLVPAVPCAVMCWGQVASAWL
jgi:hypothetical protein